MKVKEIPGKIAYGAAKQAASWVAPIVALSSTAGKGGDGYLDNVVAAFEVPKQIVKIGYFIAINKGSRDVFFGGAKDLFDIVYHSAKNIVERPTETAIAAAVIGLGVNYSPQIIKFARDKIRKNKSKR